MYRNRTGSSLVLLFLVFFTIAHDCDASFLAKFRKLVVVHGPTKTQLFDSQLNSPSPAPGPDAPAPDPPTDGLSLGSCTGSLRRCHYKTQINITACLVSSSNANEELFLLVQNDGESSLEVNVTTNKITSQKIHIPKHQIKKVNVSDGGSSSLVLNAENGTCIIDHFESPVPDNSFFRRFPYYADYATPRSGAFVLALSVLIFGGTWACCMLGKKERHIHGVPYQELEMGRSESPSGDRVETAERWDQGWDDDWDEMKAVRSPRARRNGNVLNGVGSKSSDRDGWESSWDDQDETSHVASQIEGLGG